MGPAEDEYIACRKRYPVPTLPRGDALTPNDPCFNQLMASRAEEAERQAAMRRPAPAPQARPSAPAVSGKSQYEIYAEEAARASSARESVYDRVARLREEQRLDSIRSDMNIERPDKIMPIQVPGSMSDRDQKDSIIGLAWRAKQEQDAAESARGLKTAAGVGAVALVGLGMLYLIFRNKK